jgi:hypothetical protein
LAFASLIVLFLVPSVLGMQEDLRARLRGDRTTGTSPHIAE